MRSSNPINDAEIRADTGMRAEALLEVGLSCPHLFSRNGHTLSADVAFQSQPLVSDLLKMGLFSMNLDSMVAMDEQMEGKGVSFSRVPSFLLSIGMHYAIEVAPIENSKDDPEPIVSLDALSGQVRKLESAFGRIAVDMSLVQAVSGLARDRLEADAQPEAAKEGMS